MPEFAKDIDFMAALKCSAPHRRRSRPIRPWMSGISRRRNSAFPNRSGEIISTSHRPPEASNERLERLPGGPLAFAADLGFEQADELGIGEGAEQARQRPADCRAMGMDAVAEPISPPTRSFPSPCSTVVAGGRDSEAAE